MSTFDLEASLERARKRFGASTSSRRGRSDRGQMRLDPVLAGELRRQLGGQERPPMSQLLTALAAFCSEGGLKTPSRATVYKAMSALDGEEYATDLLPPAARDALYNLSGNGVVPGPQLIFYCFNYGNLDAVSFAATLPWLNLYQAVRMRGWRPKSRGLLLAVCRARKI